MFVNSPYFFLYTGMQDILFFASVNMSYENLNQRIRVLIIS